MLHHRALGRDLDQLVVSVIDNRRPMLAVMRAMLAAIGTGRIETHESPAEALEAFALNTPDLVIAAATMEPIAGAELVRRMRHKDAGPLCAVPAMIASAHAKTGVVAEALRAGAHQVLVLPLSASTLYRRLDWLINDDRPFELLGDDMWSRGWRSVWRSASRGRLMSRPPPRSRSRSVKGRERQAPDRISCESGKPETSASSAPLDRSLRKGP